jgi:predicted 2-oxoglutarate/Fe(II)-dependent dioxygenase YbiX
MPNSEFFSRLGVFIRREGLDPTFCQALRTELRSATYTNAEVSKGEHSLVDTAIRRTKHADISPVTNYQIEQVLQRFKPALEGHFQQPLSGFEKPQCLVYQVGDYFKAHIDNSDVEGIDPQIQKRQISIVIFLNSESDANEPDTYSGGALTFYGLIAQPQWQQVGFALQGEAGLFVAFRSHIFHEVTPVTQGERLTITSWFY